MKPKKIIFAIIIMVSPIVLWYATSYFNRIYGKQYYYEIKNNEKVYCYDSFNLVLDRAFCIENINDKVEFINYYNYRVKKIDAPISFPMQTVPYDRPLFVIDNSDPLLLKVVDFDTTCWGFISVYVDRRTISNHEVSRKLVADHDDYIKGYQQSDEYKIRKLGRKQNSCISEYGIQCNCD